MTFQPCSNLAAPQRGRPGNLVPAGKRLSVPAATVRGRALAAVLTAAPVAVTLRARGEVLPQ
jgi:hypothetical protein